MRISAASRRIFRSLIEKTEGEVPPAPVSAGPDYTVSTGRAIARFLGTGEIVDRGQPTTRSPTDPCQEPPIPQRAASVGKRILQAAKGFRGGRSKLITTAKDAVRKAKQYHYRDRKNNKRNFRNLWVQRINAACRGKA